MSAIITYRETKISDKSKASVIFYNLTLTIAALLVSYFIFILKLQSVYYRPFIILFLYSILITAFQFGRLIVVLFYEYALYQTIEAGQNASEKTFSGNYQPTVSFVIPCMNEQAVIKETILNCFRVEYPLSKLEVVVIDDGSTDNTPKILNGMKGKYANLTVVQFSKNRGKRHAMMEGFRRARGEIIIQLDSDSCVHPKTFYKLIEPFKNLAVGAVCAHSDPINADKNVWTKMQAAYYFMSFRILKAVESTFNTVFCCSGCASAYRKTAIMSVLDEWVNETFLGKPVMYGDDRALSTRVVLAGYKTIYVWDAQAFTIVPDTFRKLIIQQVRWKKSWIINAFKIGRRIIFKRPLVALLYFYPLVLISFINPIIVIYALVYVPLAYHIIPYFYLVGLLLVTILFLIYYRLVGRRNRYWLYLIHWGAMSAFILSPLMIWAAIKIQNRSWGTR